MKLISKSFFKRSTLQTAKDLLGTYLVRETADGKILGKIVETEAYLWNDPASHSFSGKTKRNSPMFGPAGRAYVYFTYGMYNCFNVVTEKEGIGEAVLIRAIEPVQGIEIMKKNRGMTDEKNLCNGPGKITIAFAISRDFNCLDLTNKNSPLKIFAAKKENFEIVETERIGISEGKELPHRFYIKGNRFVSKK